MTRRQPHEPAASAAGNSSDVEFDLDADLNADSEFGHDFDPDFDFGFPDPFEEIGTRSAPPPSTVDIARAMTEGKRTRRKRALGVTSGVAAGLAAICVATLVMPGSHAVHAQTASSGLPITSTNPFTVGARFGWLPNGVEQDSSSLSQNALWLTAENTIATGAKTSPYLGFWLSTFPQGSSEQSALAAISADKDEIPGAKGRPATAQAIPSIGGRPAYTISNPEPNTSGTQEVTLLWQMSNGRWAQLVENFNNGKTGTDTDALTAQARHVAETVTPDATGTPLPMSVTGLPSGGQITYYNLTRWTDMPNDWAASFDVKVAGVTLVYDEGLVGQIMPAAIGPSKCIIHGDLEGCVTLSSGHLSGAFPAGGLQALANDVNLRTPDKTTWTTDVFPDY